ncbi:hypothetical protein pb186bvf_004345 [Paramecium bursaria]
MKKLYFMMLFINFIQSAVITPDQCETYTTWQSHNDDVLDGCKIKRCMPGCQKCTAYAICQECQTGFTYYSGILNQISELNAQVYLIETQSIHIIILYYEILLITISQFQEKQAINYIKNNSNRSMKITMILLLVNQLIISNCQTAIPITNKCANYTPPSYGYHIRPDANCIIPAIQVSYCPKITNPVGFFKHENDCKLYQCMIGCKQCVNSRSCTECFPELTYYGGGLLNLIYGKGILLQKYIQMIFDYTTYKFYKQKYSKQNQQILIKTTINLCFFTIFSEAIQYHCYSVNGNICSRSKEGTTFYAGILSELGSGPKCITSDELYLILKLYGIPIGCSVTNNGQCVQ